MGVYYRRSYFIGRCRFFTVLIITEKPQDLLSIGVFLIFPLIMGIFFITKPFIPEKSGLSVMEIKDAILSMIIYDKEKTKHTLQIPLQDIELFKVKVDNDNGPYEGRPSHVNLAINSKDGQKYNFSYDVQYYYKIQQLVSVARFFPNFSYEVNAKWDVLEKMLLNYAKTGKDIGFVNMMRSTLESKDVPKTDKLTVGLRIAYLIGIIITVIYIISWHF